MNWLTKGRISLTVWSLLVPGLGYAFMKERERASLWIVLAALAWAFAGWQVALITHLLSGLAASWYLTRLVRRFPAESAAMLARAETSSP